MRKISWGLFISFLILVFLWRCVFSGREVSILMYHSISSKGCNICVSNKKFLQQMKFIKKGRYNVLSLREYCSLLKEKRGIPSRSVVITFDDGYRDNLKAVKILERFNFPATIFLIVNRIDKEGYLTQEDIKEILKNTKVEIGSHTFSHKYLPSLGRKELEKEIRLSKERLEELFGVKIDTISYPVGGFNKEVLKIVKEAGYICGCTTNRGFSKKLNRFALRRIKITQKDTPFTLWAKLSGLYYFFKKIKSPY